MANMFNGEWTEILKGKAQAVLDFLELDGCSVSFSQKEQAFHFKSGFKEMTVLLSLVESKRWIDIRHIYRATLQSGPQVINHKGPNEWSRGEFDTH
ncbi:MAG: hypothetical protein AB7F59_08395 [Bdellovibrionales bacterium]